MERIASARDSQLVTIADLDEARNRAMGQRLSRAAQALEWNSDARLELELEKETIYLRERLLTIVEEAREARVTLAHVQQARRPPPGIAPMSMGGTSVAEDPDTRPSWPVTFGAYKLLDPKGSIAICTLARDLMGRVASAPPSGVAIVGRAYTENFGVEKLVTNVVANPNLRTLLLCGTESRHRVGQTLLDLHANGRDENGRVVTDASPLPIVRSLSDDAIRIFQEKMEILDLRGSEDVDQIAERAATAQTEGREPWPQTWEPSVPSVRQGGQSPMGMAMGTGGMASRFSPDPTGLFLIGLGPWADCIEMEHYTRDGVLDYRIRGNSADALCATLLEHGLVGDFSHALYVGRELQKAEVALKLSLEYEQDRQLEIP